MPTTRRTSTEKPRRESAKPGKAFRYPGASTNPLTSKRKGIICQLAQHAHKHQRIGYAVEVWRREQQEMAAGLSSLTHATQADFLMLKAHFLGLAGEGGKQFQAAYRDQDEVKRQQRHLLENALNDRDLALEYAEKICRVQYKRSLDEATADQLARIKFTVESRRPVVVTAAPQPADHPF